MWYKELMSSLISIGYEITDADLGMLVKYYKKATSACCTHVDDIDQGSWGNSDDMAYLDKEFWDLLENKYPGIKLQRGPRYRHLSCEIFYDKKNKSQETCIKSMMQAAGITGYRDLPHRGDLLSAKESKQLGPNATSRFRSLLQQAAYAVNVVPTIRFTVSVLQRKTTSPTEQDAEDLLHLLKYLHKHASCRLTFAPKDLQIRAFSDASFGVHSDQRGHYGYLLTLGGAHNSPFITKDGQIKTQSRSSTEDEIHAVNATASDVLWARDIMTALGFIQKAVPIYEDNESVITMLQREPRNFQTKSKHVRVKWAFFREQFKCGYMYLEHCPTTEMTADIFTKPLMEQVFHKHATTVVYSSNAYGGVLITMQYGRSDNGLHRLYRYPD